MNGYDQAATLRAVRTSSSASGQIIPLRHTARRQRVIAISGGKGGVGKSTLAVNLACSYANAGARTLVFDGDLGMADLSLLLDVAPEKTLLDLLDGTGGDDVLVEAHGVHLLPGMVGSSELANMDDTLRAALMAQVAKQTARFDTTVIDTGAGIQRDTMALAASASEVVVVATPERLSTYDAYACLKVLSLEHGVRKVFVLPNNCRSEAEANLVFHRLQTLVSRFLRLELVELPFVPHDPTFRDAAPGIPAIIARPDGVTARAVKRVARTLDAHALSAAQETR